MGILGGDVELTVPVFYRPRVVRYEGRTRPDGRKPERYPDNDACHDPVA